MTDNLPLPLLRKEGDQKTLPLTCLPAGTAKGKSEGVFGVVWRLALLALPWQTRWFHDASLAGWPWEQGRWSVYGSWVLLAATIIIGLTLPLTKGELEGVSGRPKTSPRPSFVRRGIFAALFACTFVPILFHSDQAARFVAVSQWWMEALILMGFGLVLIGAKIPWRSIATWFVVSLIPQAFLGIVQYAMQNVIGTKWLGIATHLSKVPGTSVVEFGLFRYLRAYGGFPHPNIFGGWLAVGIVAALALAGTAVSKKAALFAIFSSALFSVVFVLTFSRGAWIAAAVGIVVLCWTVLSGRGVWRTPSDSLPSNPADRSGRAPHAPTSQFFWLALAASLLSVLIVGFSQRAVVFARTDTADRLETKSIDQRTQSLRDGVALFLTHPLFGSGPNAELLDLRNIDAKLAGKPVATFKAPEPLEPPADAYLLALADLGVVGTLLLIAFLTQTIRHIPRSAWPFVGLFGVLALFDHYLWSTWSGACLVLVLVLLSQNFFENKEP